MRNSTAWWILLALIILLDLYFFQSLKVVTQGSAPRTRTIIHYAYWIISLGVIALLVLMPYLHLERYSRFLRTTLFAILSGWFFAKFFASVFFAIDDTRRLVMWIGDKFSDRGAVTAPIPNENSIPRSVFLSWAGMIAGSGLFGTLLYGFGNKYRYQVRRVRMKFANLPASFSGFRFVHISDIHSGSFTRKVGVMRGIQKILAEKPDLILFTGDLVNNVADEMDEYMDVFNQLRATHGVYSILGNHDYGDYVSWPSKEARAANLEKLKKIHAQLGWRLLINEHVPLERNGERIALLGVENWSAKARFPKYGNLKAAHAGSEHYPFKILMSHDPSHWKTEVLDAYHDIDLMLSGHTHGMQFGVEIPGLKWSPVQYVYKEWAGLYEKNGQKLYVNRGFGFLGYPGRVGILPEITVVELEKEV
jgi:predicted MPP superfamily phosphohydrolase